MALAATCLWATLDDVKPWLRLVPAQVDHDAVLEQIANSVTEELERMTDRVFVTRAISETFDSTETLGARKGAPVWRFVLRGYPVTTSPLTTFTIDGVAVDADDYVLDAARGEVRLLRAYGSATGIGDAVMGYTAGYSRSTLQDTVRQVGAEMVAHRYQDWCAGANAAQSVQFGSVQYVPRSAWPYHIKDAITALRHEVRGGVVA